MTGFHRNRRSKRPKTMHFQVGLQHWSYACAIVNFQVRELDLTNPDSQDPKYCGWWSKATVAAGASVFTRLIHFSLASDLGSLASHSKIWRGSSSPRTSRRRQCCRCMHGLRRMQYTKPAMWCLMFSTGKAAHRQYPSSASRSSISKQSALGFFHAAC
jgi:hypothetical protein